MKVDSLPLSLRHHRSSYWAFILFTATLVVFICYFIIIIRILYLLSCLLASFLLLYRRLISVLLIFGFADFSFHLQASFSPSSSTSFLTSAFIINAFSSSFSRPTLQILLLDYNFPQPLSFP